MAINMNTYNNNLLNFRTISFYNVKFGAKTKELPFTFIDYIFISILKISGQSSEGEYI